MAIRWLDRGYSRPENPVIDQNSPVLCSRVFQYLSKVTDCDGSKRNTESVEEVVMLSRETEDFALV